MKALTSVIGVAAMLLLTAGAASAGPGCDSATKTAKAEGASCPISAAKAAYSETMAETGCEKSAKKAANYAMAEHAYNAAYADSDCSKTAMKAAYTQVHAETGCEKTAEAAAKHAAAQAAYDHAMAKSGCEKTAKAAYQKAMSGGCDKGSETAAGVTTAANTKAGCDWSASDADTKQAKKAGCDKRNAYQDAAVKAYHHAYDSSHCSKTAMKAAYEAVVENGGCSATAKSSATHAVAQAAYDATYEKTGCERSAKKAYEKASDEAVKLAESVANEAKTAS
jgi:hypothetical protein